MCRSAATYVYMYMYVDTYRTHILYMKNIARKALHKVIQNEYHTS